MISWVNYKYIIENDHTLRCGGPELHCGLMFFFRTIKQNAVCYWNNSNYKGILLLCISNTHTGNHDDYNIVKFSL